MTGNENCAAVTGWQPDAVKLQRRGEAEIIETKFPGWAVLFGPYSRLFWAFGAPDGEPISASSASALLGFMRAADQHRRYYQTVSPAARWDAFNKQS